MTAMQGALVVLNTQGLPATGNVSLRVARKPSLRAIAPADVLDATLMVAFVARWTDFSTRYIT